MWSKGTKREMSSLRWDTSKEDTMKTDNDILPTWQRWATLATLACMLALLGFFSWHQATNTGFFTDRFGSLEMLALYGPIVVSSAAPVVRMITGRLNPARPFDALTSVCLALGSLWLAVGFPLNFVHLADVLPEALRFLLAWISNDIGRFVLILQVVVSAIGAPLGILTYVTVRRRLSTA